MQGILEAIKLIYEIIMAAKSIAGFIQANKDEAWFQKSAEVVQKIKDAKTEDEYKTLAKELRDLWASAG